MPAGNPSIKPGTNTSFGALKQIDAGVLNVGYAEAGSAEGPAVILLHGWPYDIHSFVEVAPLLASAGYRVIVPHLRGHGTTRFLSNDAVRNGQPAALALDVVSLMDALKIQTAILAGFEASLTLPGIAGLVLTIGMAVDANIIIYERIREELRLDKSVRTAVDAGFARAFWTVFDAHVTNFVAGVVLYSYGSGPIRGFAVTLLVGIITNLFTSYWLSHWMFDALVGRRGVAKSTLSI